jgi:hypothetical protein
MNNIIAITLLTTILATGVGCASADARMASRQDYRAAQVQAISVQKAADAQAAAAASAERTAMWEALAAASAHDPNVGTHMAIVAAVSVGRGTDPLSSKVTTLAPEAAEPTALDYVKAVSPALIGGLTAVGMSAISADVQKNASDNMVAVRRQEIVTDGLMYGVFNNAIDSLEPVVTTADTSVSSDTSVGVVDVDTTSVTVDTTTTTTTVDDTTADTVVDDTVVDDSTSSYYNDTECTEPGQELVQTSWGKQCQ